MKMIVSALCLGLFSLAAHASNNPPFEWPEAYSVESQMTVNGMETTTRLFVDGKKMRTETEVMGMLSITILRPDLGKSFTVMPAQNILMENPLPEEAGSASCAAGTGSSEQWEKAGRSEINGQSCTEYKVHGSNAPVSFFVSDKGELLRMVTEMATIDYRNFQPGKPDASLFDPPAN